MLEERLADSALAARLVEMPVRVDIRESCGCTPDI